MISTVGPLFRDQTKIRTCYVFRCFCQGLAMVPKIARKRRSFGLWPPRTRPSAKIGRRAGLRALNIQTGRVTPGTPASGRPATLADGPGSTMWGAKKSDGELIAVMCCLVCQTSPRLMRPSPKKVKESDGTNPLSRDGSTKPEALYSWLWALVLESRVVGGVSPLWRATAACERLRRTFSGDLVGLSDADSGACQSRLGSVMHWRESSGS